MPIPNILILDDASLKISSDDTALNLKELGCVGNHLELSPDTAVTTVDTFCGSVDYPGTTKWSLVATLYQSFDLDQTEDVLSAALAFGGPVAYEVVPYKSKAIGADNPAWSGLVVPAPYAPINGDAGDASTVELEWALTGAPTKRETPTALAADELEGLSRAELDERAREAGLNPADYSNKDEVIKALRAQQPTLVA